MQIQKNVHLNTISTATFLILISLRPSQVSIIKKFNLCGKLMTDYEYFFNHRF